MERKLLKPRQPAFTEQDLETLKKLYYAEDEKGYPITMTRIVSEYNKKTGQKRTQPTIESRLKSMVRSNSLIRVDRSSNIKRNKKSWIDRAKNG